MALPCARYALYRGPRYWRLLTSSPRAVPRACNALVTPAINLRSSRLALQRIRLGSVNTACILNSRHSLSPDNKPQLPQPALPK